MLVTPGSALGDRQPPGLGRLEALPTKAGLRKALWLFCQFEALAELASQESHVLGPMWGHPK